MTEAPGRILLVDDEPAFLRATRRLLEHHGLHVEAHGAALSALAALRERPFDLIVTDLHLPDHSGIELLRWAAEHGLGTAAIVITGMPSIESSVDALRLAAVDYIAKPLDAHDFVARVRRGVQTNRLRQGVSDARRRTQDLGQMLDALRLVLDRLGGAEAASRGEAAPAAAAASDGLRGLGASERATLSARELEVLTHMASGKAPKEIASSLFISHHTVRNHLRSIYSKLGVHSQLELLRRISG